ncbi:hypothetical protein WICPIJ_003453, partial [Wickerhamomyces pijperi]
VTEIRVGQVSRSWLLSSADVMELPKMTIADDSTYPFDSDSSTMYGNAKEVGFVDVRFADMLPIEE